MKFTEENEITFKEAARLLYEKLGPGQVMALATSVNDHVMVRNVSCLFYDNRIWFKTDIHFRKAKQIFANPNVALCWSGVQVEGRAENRGLVAEEPGLVFKHAFDACFPEGYSRYSHEDTEIIIEISPVLAEIWDNSRDGAARQIFIDFQKEAVQVKTYDI